MSPDNPIQGAGTDRHPAATSGNRCGYATVVFAGQCDAQDPSPRTQAPHGTTARWNAGCGCVTCRRAHSDIARIRKRAKADARLPVEVRQQLLDQINAGQPFKAALRDLGLTPNRVWGLAQTDEEWSTALEAAVWPHAETPSSTGPTPRTSRAASAKSAGSTSASGWAGTGEL